MEYIQYESTSLTLCASYCLTVGNGLGKAMREPMHLLPLAVFTGNNYFSPIQIYITTSVTLAAIRIMLALCLLLMC